ncbi:MAG: hypothetical protein KAU31_04630, partial [Spirochaetaceae bacterium]|nr:hypothetical protein [Spirochaetaceae bacterium]
ISQIIATDFSAIPFTGNYATETISQTDDGFSAYLARIMDTPYQQPVDDPFAARRTPEAPKEQKPIVDDSLIRRKESELAQPHTDELTHTAENPAAAKSAARGADAGARKKSGAEAAAVADLKRKSAASSITGASNEYLAISAADAPDTDADILHSVAGSSGSNQTLAVGDKPGKGQIAEIDVVLENQKLVENLSILENSSRSVLKDMKGAAVRGRQAPVEKDRKGVSVARTSNGADRTVAGISSEERSQTGRKTRIVVRDLRERGARESGTGNTASEPVKGADGSASGLISGNDSQNSGDHSFTSLLGVKSGGSDSSARRPVDGTTNLRTNPGVLHSLRQTLNDQVNGEIVRTARMVVRGNDTGEIRLHLKPENLGNVRIILQMQEGHIAG